MIYKACIAATWSSIYHH